MKNGVILIQLQDQNKKASVATRVAEGVACQEAQILRQAERRQEGRRLTGRVEVQVKTLRGYTMAVEAGSIEDIRLAIEAEWSVAAGYQKLMYNGREMRDLKQLESGTQCAMIHLVCRLRGGGGEESAAVGGAGGGESVETPY